MYCPKCRTELPDDAIYCIKCGYDFTKIKTPPSHKASSDPFDDIETSLGQEVETSSFEKGFLFANRYEILDEGKKGGMGAVYKCKDTELNEVIALKVMHSRLVSSPQALTRFKQEVAISRKLHHENIVEVHDISEHENLKYFTMEWAEGETLRDILIQRKKEEKPFSLSEAYTIISQLCDALQYAHQYTVHRDIKPENILISDEKTLALRLTDFGIAKMLSPSQFTSTSMQMGTPYYMAPEQKVDAGNVDKRADIYALGVVLFELLTLENTIGLKMPSKINKRLSSEIDSIIEKALEPKPEDRYTDARELSAALHAVVTAETLRTEQKKKEEETRKIEAERRTQEEEQRKREEAKRQEEKRQREAAEEKAKIEAERKRIEEEQKKKEAERKKQEEEKIRQEQSRREEEARQKKKEEESKGKNKWLIIAVAAVIMIAVAVFALRSKGPEQSLVEPLVTTEVPRPAPAPAPAAPMVAITAEKSRALELMANGKEKENAGRYEEALKLYKEAKKAYTGLTNIDKMIGNAEEKIAEEKKNAEEAKRAEEKRRAEEAKKAEEAQKEEENKKSSIPMVFVKGGCFQMGDTFGDGDGHEKPVHEVCLDSFYIGKYEITRGQWEDVMGNNPSHPHHCKDDECPVESVSWNDVQEFIRKLNQKTGKNYRLPTEAEWEYAARSGGKAEKYAGGNDVDSVAWHSSNTGGKKHIVGQKQANGLGIYDMSGNVWEWVNDWYGSYSRGSQNNPKGPSSGSFRIIRGGGWSWGPRIARASLRANFRPDDKWDYIGFRLAASVK